MRSCRVSEGGTVGGGDSDDEELAVVLFVSVLLF